MFFRLIRLVSRSRLATTAISIPSIRLASSFVLEEETLPDLPPNPIEIPSTPNQLTNKFLLKQSSVLSAEAAARTLTLLVSTIEDQVDSFIQVTSELANLYEIGNVQLFVNLIFILYARWRFKIVCLQIKLASLTICKKS